MDNEVKAVETPAGVLALTEFKLSALDTSAGEGCESCSGGSDCGGGGGCNGCSSCSGGDGAQ